MEPPLFVTTAGTGTGVVHVKDHERRQLLNVLTPPILNGNADGDDAAGGGIFGGAEAPAARTLGDLSGSVFPGRRPGCRMRALTALRSMFVATLTGVQPWLRDVDRERLRCWKLVALYVMLDAYTGHYAAANPFLPFAIAAAYRDHHVDREERILDPDDLVCSSSSDEEAGSSGGRPGDDRTRRRSSDSQQEVPVEPCDEDPEFDKAARSMIFMFFYTPGVDYAEEDDIADNPPWAKSPDALAGIAIDVRMANAITAAAAGPAMETWYDKETVIDHVTLLLRVLGLSSGRGEPFTRAIKDEQIMIAENFLQPIKERDLQDRHMQKREETPQLVDAHRIAERLVEDVVVNPGYFVNGWLSNEKEQQDLHHKKELLKLIREAYASPLVPRKQQDILVVLQTHPELAAILPASDFPRAVEHNPSVAAALLLICHTYADPSDLAHEHVFARSIARAQFTRQLNSLVETESVSLQSMEVVNKIITAGPKNGIGAPRLPPDFLRSYVLGIIQKTRSMTNASLRHRFVRLVCVFLNSIIRHVAKPFASPPSDRSATMISSPAARSLSSAFGDDADEVLEVVVAFCIEHSRIREAANLFRALKA